MRDAYLDAVGVAVRLLDGPEVAAAWAEPSALPEYQVSGLAGHLARNVLVVRDALEAPASTPPIPILEHFTGDLWPTAPGTHEVHLTIRRHGAQAAAAGPAALAERVRGELAWLRRTVPAQPVDRVVQVPRKAWCLTLDDYLLTRLVEVVVHVDDLAVSVGVTTPTLPGPATDAVIALLARLSVWRHGPMPVVRALARRERAPDTIAAI